MRPEVRHRAMIAPNPPLQRVCLVALILLAGVGTHGASAAGTSIVPRNAVTRRTTAHGRAGIAAAEFLADEDATRLSCPGNVRAGEIVELRWSAPSADIEELEIMLSLDGGRTYDVRVSPELDPRANVWRWRVPNLPTSDARLRLRLGTRRGEREGMPTRAFTILAASDRPIERRQVHEGRWWDGPDAFERVAPLASLGAPGESLQSSAQERAAALPPRTPDVAEECVTSGSAPATTVTDPATAARSAPHAARFFPLRN
jgi:hypothetical protein